MTRKLRRRTGFTLIQYVGAAAAMLFVLIFVVAGVLVAKKANTGTRVGPTPSQLELLQASPALAVKPWMVENPQWVMGLTLVLFTVLRRYVFAYATDRIYHHLTPEKRMKCANYMLEITGTTAALAVCSATGFWDLSFNPGDYDITRTKVPMDRIESLARGSNLVYSIFVCMYCLELCFDPNIRPELAMHHCVAIVLSLWGAWALGYVSGDLMLMRAFFALSLYMSTEGIVFMTLLLYQKQIYWALVVDFTAWYYATTRPLIMILSIWSWVEAYDGVFKVHEHNSFVPYSLWLSIPFANVLLNGAQFSTTVNMFGLAKRVHKLRRYGSRDKKIQQLFDVMDLDQDGHLSAAEWRSYLTMNVFTDVLLPGWAYDASFEMMDGDKVGSIKLPIFSTFMSPLLARSEVEVSVVFKVMVLMMILSCGHALSEHEVALYADYLDAALAAGDYGHLEKALATRTTEVGAFVDRSPSNMGSPSKCEQPPSADGSLTPEMLGMQAGTYMEMEDVRDV